MEEFRQRGPATTPRATPTSTMLVTSKFNTNTPSTILTMRESAANDETSRLSSSSSSSVLSQVIIDMFSGSHISPIADVSTKGTYFGSRNGGVSTTSLQTSSFSSSTTTITTTTSSSAAKTRGFVFTSSPTRGGRESGSAASSSSSSSSSSSGGSNNNNAESSSLPPSVSSFNVRFLNPTFLLSGSSSSSSNTVGLHQHQQYGTNSAPTANNTNVLARAELVRSVLLEMDAVGTIPDTDTAVAAVTTFGLAGMGGRAVDVCATVAQVMMNGGASPTAIRDVVLHPRTVSAMLVASSCEGAGAVVRTIWVSYSRAAETRRKAGHALHDLMAGTGYSFFGAAAAAAEGEGGEEEQESGDTSSSSPAAALEGSDRSKNAHTGDHMDENGTFVQSNNGQHKSASKKSQPLPRLTAAEADVEFASRLKSLYALSLAIALTRSAVAPPPSTANTAAGVGRANAAGGGTQLAAGETLSALHSLAVDCGVVMVDATSAAAVASASPSEDVPVAIAAAIAITYRVSGYRTQARRILSTTVQAFAAHTASMTYPMVDIASFPTLVLALGICGLSNDLRALMMQVSSKAIASGAVDKGKPLNGADTTSSHVMQNNQSHSHSFNNSPLGVSALLAWFGGHIIRTDEGAVNAVWQQLSVTPAMQRLALLAEQSATTPSSSDILTLPLGSVAATLLPSHLLRSPTEASAATISSSSLPSPFALLCAGVSAPPTVLSATTNSASSSSSSSSFFANASSNSRSQRLGTFEIDEDDFTNALTSPPQPTSTTSSSFGIVSAISSSSSSSSSTSSVSPCWLASNLRAALLLATGRLRDALVEFLPHISPIAASRNNNNGTTSTAASIASYHPLPETITLILHAVCADVSPTGSSLSSMRIPQSLLTGMFPNGRSSSSSSRKNHKTSQELLEEEAGEGSNSSSKDDDVDDGQIPIDDAESYIAVVQAILAAARGYGIRPRPSDLAAVIELHASLGNLRLGLGDVRGSPGGACALQYASLVRGMTRCASTTLMEAEWIAKSAHEDGVDVSHAGLAGAVEGLSIKFGADLHVAFHTNKAAGVAAVASASSLTPTAVQPARESGTPAATAISLSCPHMPLATPANAGAYLLARCVLMQMADLPSTLNNLAVGYRGTGLLPASAASSLGIVAHSVTEATTGGVVGYGNSNNTTTTNSGGSNKTNNTATFLNTAIANMLGGGVSSQQPSMQLASSTQAMLLQASGPQAMLLGAGTGSGGSSSCATGVRIPDFVDEGHVTPANRAAARAAAAAGTPSGFQLFSRVGVSGGAGPSGADGTPSIVPAGSWKLKRAGQGMKDDNMNVTSLTGITALASSTLAAPPTPHNHNTMQQQQQQSRLTTAEMSFSPSSASAAAGGRSGANGNNLIGSNFVDENSMLSARASAIGKSNALAAVTSVSALLRKDVWDYRNLGYAGIASTDGFLLTNGHVSSSSTPAIVGVDATARTGIPDFGQLVSALATAPPTFEASVRALRRAERAAGRAHVSAPAYHNNFDTSFDSIGSHGTQRATAVDYRAANASLPIAAAIVRAERAAAINAGRNTGSASMASLDDSMTSGALSRSLLGVSSSSGIVLGEDAIITSYDDDVDPDEEMAPETILLEETCREAHADTARLQAELHSVAAQLAVAEAQLNAGVHIRWDIASVARAMSGHIGAATSVGVKPSAALLYVAVSGGAGGANASSNGSSNTSTNALVSASAAYTSNMHHGFSSSLTSSNYNDASNGAIPSEGGDSNSANNNNNSGNGLNPLKSRQILRKREATLKSALERLRAEESALLAALKEKNSAGGNSFAAEVFRTHNESVGSLSSTCASLEAKIESDDRRVIAAEDATLSTREGLRTWAGIGAGATRLSNQQNNKSNNGHTNRRAADEDATAAALDALSQLSSTMLTQSGRQFRNARARVRTVLETQAIRAQASVACVEELAHAQASLNSRVRALITSFSRELDRMSSGLEEEAAIEDALRLATTQLAVRKDQLAKRHAIEAERVEEAVAKMRSTLARELRSRVDTAQSDVSRVLDAAATKGKMSAAVEGAAQLDAVRRSYEVAVAQAQQEAADAVSPAVHAQVAVGVRSQMRLEEALESTLSATAGDAGKRRELHARIAAETTLLQAAEASLLRARGEADHIVAVDAALRGMRNGTKYLPPAEVVVPSTLRRAASAVPSSSSLTNTGFGTTPASVTRGLSVAASVLRASGGPQATLAPVEDSASALLWNHATSLGLTAFDLCGTVEEAVAAITPSVGGNSSSSSSNNQQQQMHSTDDAVATMRSLESLAYGISLGSETDADTAAAAMFSLDAVIAMYEDELASVRSRNNPAAAGGSSSSSSFAKQLGLTTSSSLPLPPDPTRAASALRGSGTNGTAVSVLDALSAADKNRVVSRSMQPSMLPSRAPPSAPLPSSISATLLTTTSYPRAGVATSPSSLALEALASAATIRAGPGVLGTPSAAAMFQAYSTVSVVGGQR